MAKQVTFSIEESLKRVQRELNSLAPSIEAEMNKAIKEVAHAAYAAIAAKAQQALNSTRQDYLKGLQFEDLGDNNFLISLEGNWPNALEEGFPSFNMTPGMLASTKTVQVGSRAGQPWVQQTKPKGKNKESHKFAHVPLEQHPHSKAAKTANMAEAIRELTATNLKGMDQKLTKVFKNSDGSVAEGKVAVIKPAGAKMTGSTPYALGTTTDSKLQGLVKYQKVYKNKEGKETVSSVYIKYRTVSEKGRPWIHPGFKGIRAFEDAEKQIAEQIDKIVATLVK